MHTIPLILPPEATRITDTINGLSESLIKRDDFALYSLGAAAYLDAPTQNTIDKFDLDVLPQDIYLKRLAENNDLLMNYFSDIYFRLQQQLQNHLGEKVCYAIGKALPGFHIFNAHAQYANASAHVPHYDRQYEQLTWTQTVTPFNARTISFTLPISLPASGGGLYLWPLDLTEVLNTEKSEVAKLVRAAKCTAHKYAIGELICHNGHQLHRIAPWVSATGDQRITLQGHGLFIDDMWKLYW
jgi:hypothetical protein